MALITLERKITFSEHVRPICLPTVDADFDFYGKMATVAGWGKVSEIIYVFKMLIRKDL